MPLDDIRHQLHQLGLPARATVIVHSSFSRVKPVDSGPAGLIDALEGAIGPAGTLVMPSMSDDDDHVFDPRTTPCRSMGIVADTFWRMAGVLRSDSPHAFAAKGPAAAAITAPHPWDVPHGPDSPVGRVHLMGGWILLLGVGHDANTTVHLAEALAGVRYRLDKTLAISRNGRAETVAYREIDHCCQRFSLADGWLDAKGLQRHGTVGKADARLVRSRSVVDVVTAEIRKSETVFLHPAGVDAECDAARASLGG